MISYIYFTTIKKKGLRKENYDMKDHQCVQLLELKHMLRAVYPYASGNRLADSSPNGFTENEPPLIPQLLLLQTE